MKRLFLFAAMALMGMTACQQAEETSGAASGEVDVMVTTTLPAEMGLTRAAGDGTSINRCIMEIYLDGTLYGSRKVASVANLKATFSVRLIAGETYDLVFWADCANGTTPEDFTDKHYSTTTLSNVTIADVATYTGNDDTRDAFFGKTQVVADQTQAVSVTLKRPFGQINVQTLDMADVPAAQQPTSVKIAFESVPTGINLLTGELLTDSKSAVAYSTAAPLVDNTNNAGKLTFDYIFAPQTAGEQYLANFTMSFYGAGDAKVASDYVFTSIPAQRNYRTLVSGNLLTKKADVTVTVDPEFEEGDIEHEIVEVSNPDDLLSNIENGGSVRLGCDMELDESIVVSGNSAAIDLNGKTLTAGAIIMNARGGELSIENGKIVANEMSSAASTIFNAEANGVITLDGVTVETNGTVVGPATAAEGDNSTVVVKNSTIKCGAYAVATNASAPAPKNVKIVLENSTLEGDTPICVNIPCDFTMDGCTVIGGMQAMMLRGGTATISNSTLTFDTTNSFKDEADAKSFADYFLTSNWGSGNMVNLSALTVGNKAPNAYQYPTVLNLVKTTVETVGTYASLFPAMYVWANEGEGLGVTITYDEECEFTGGITYGNDGKNITVNGQAQ